MKFLVDANVLSEPTKPAPDPGVLAWLRVHETDIAVDLVILGELRFGILILPKGKNAPHWNGGSTRAPDVSTVSRGTSKQA